MSALALVSGSSDQVTDDFDLVAGVRAGDDRAFELLFLRYQARIAGYVRGMVHDHGRAEDVTQEVFISALRRIRATEAEINFKPWIYEIAKNACIDAFRRSRNTHEVPFDAQDSLGEADRQRYAGPGVTPDSAIDAKFTIDNLRGAFGGLSQTHHEILVMREFEGLSYREIGERLGMSRAGVESTLFRARRRLSEEYEDLISGERCARVQRIVDAGSAQTVGLRDQRRMARHISHCQPCRRYAHLSAADTKRPAAAATRIAAVVALPAFGAARRRLEFGDDAGQVAGAGHAAGAQWPAQAVGAVDPGFVGGWNKAVVDATRVAPASGPAVAAGSSRAGDARHDPGARKRRRPVVRARERLRGVDERNALRSAQPDAAVPAGATTEPAIAAASPSTALAGTVSSTVCATANLTTAAPKLP